MQGFLPITYTSLNPDLLITLSSKRYNSSLAFLTLSSFLLLNVNATSLVNGGKPKLFLISSSFS